MSDKKIAIVACSDPISDNTRMILNELIACLNELDLAALLAPTVLDPSEDPGLLIAHKAQNLNAYFADDDIKAIFDISGGNLANTIIPYLDYSLLKRKHKPFFGYSDLTSILNAIYAKTDKPTYLYQLRNIYQDKSKMQKQAFANMVNNVDLSLFTIKWRFIRKEQVSGIMIGGNIRCFLKLAGTPYMPKLADKILFLESYGGELALIQSFMAQLKQLPDFAKLKGIALGTFTMIDKQGQTAKLITMVADMIQEYDMALLKTEDVGHGVNAKCLIIGQNYNLQKAENDEGIA
ncbi:MAG: LD-carboxypeptidase [Erysipelotrichaceae bacterium]|nr:LD-carboxypeptidase [Erysipelotrichaceae bacterium]